MQIYNEYHKKALFLCLKNVNRRKFCSQCHGDGFGFKVWNNNKEEAK